jgi:hypothetical protein
MENIIHLADMDVDVWLPTGSQIEYCKGPNCRKPIYFVEMEGHYRKQPIIKKPDGTWGWHFTDCVDRKMFLK